VQANASDQVVVKVKRPWDGGITHLGMLPLEFMKRLAASVPRPTLHTMRLRGVLLPKRCQLCGRQFDGLTGSKGSLD
jgi:Putative transposase